jgi:hypothetical protein
MNSFEKSAVIISVPWDFARDVPRVQMIRNELVFNNLTAKGSARETPRNQFKLMIGSHSIEGFGLLGTGLSPAV